MAVRLSSLEQLMPFPTAADMLASKPVQGLVSISPDATVLEAMQLMADRQIGFLVVIASGAMAGVVSERDCARKALLRQLPVAGTAVRAIMTTPVHTIAPHAKIPECIVRMHEKGIRHLPVVVGEEILGVLSVRDLMAALIARHERLLRRLEHERLTLLFPDPSSY